MVVPTTINKQRRAQEISKGRASRVLSIKGFPSLIASSSL
jgi:hypothetical protein